MFFGTDNLAGLTMAECENGLTFLAAVTRELAKHPIEYGDQLRFVADMESELKAELAFYGERMREDALRHEHV